MVLVHEKLFEEIEKGMKTLKIFIIIEISWKMVTNIEVNLKDKVGLYLWSNMFY